MKDTNTTDDRLHTAEDIFQPFCLGGHCLYNPSQGELGVIHECCRLMNRPVASLGQLATYAVLPGPGRVECDIPMLLFGDYWMTGPVAVNMGDQLRESN